MVGENESLARREIVFLLDPVEHLARSLFGEGQQQDALGGDPFLPKSPVALDQHPRFSGAGSGDDQQRPVGVIDRGPLGVGQRRAGRDHRTNRLADPLPDPAGAPVPCCRNRISRTAGAPIPSFSRSINIVRSR